MATTVPDRCSVLNISEPMLGSALTDEQLLIVEQPGAWGSDALTRSGLNRDILKEALVHYPQARVMLARHPSRTRLLTSRKWWSVMADSASTLKCRSGQIAADAALPANVWTEDATAAPVLFLCTNGRRDACCAEFGRALLGELGRDERVWEISHLGGHRFAPTGLALPDGVMPGRLDKARVELWLAGNPVPLEYSRGRVGRSDVRQVAEAVVGRSIGLPLESISAEQVGESELVVRSGEAAWLVRLQRGQVRPRAKSCGAASVDGTSWLVSGITSII